MRHMLALKYVDAVARAGSIRAAAEVLAITPSALNRRILAIEEELDIEIFERHALGVRLNSAGELFIHHIRAQMADLERVRSQIADLSGVRIGHVRIATTKEIGGRLLPRLIQSYRADFPGVTFSLHAYDRGQVEQQLQNLEADIVVMFQPLRLADMQVISHQQQHLSVALAADHPLAAHAELRLVDFLEHHPLLPPRGEGIREIVEAACVKKGLNCKPAIESDDMALLRHLARQGAGLALDLPLTISASPTEADLVYRPFKANEIEPGFLFVGQLYKRTLPVAARKFADRLREMFELETNALSGVAAN
ncbi:LysR family transcriptional regulator [Maritalea mediterranea]|uniref:LysR family transcriptional regulator n=1 Tax=Maritalea mediterranea TaxID=2909667 RepID=A0ABS9E9J0_9HYPH|nr:LysR family transcriptional regulator [Maritalea mediterranea]MCF4098116.1 LysR family transcriptional regulator [Maritalea mediterranea]